jgi:hypothetical protein
MILHPVLLSLNKIVHNTKPNLDAAVLPDLKIISGDSIQIENPMSDYELWLNRTIDYGVVQYNYIKMDTIKV